MSASTLTGSERQSLLNLINAFYSNRTKFKWTGDITRNIYTDKDCYDSDGKIKLSCSLMCQLIWAGISPDTFVGKKNTYKGDIIKTIDWGYYFQFPRRVAYGLTNSSGKPIGYTQTTGGIEGAFSANSFYSASADNKYGQKFLSYMTASDMAQELYLKGYEIPLSEVMTGDLVFFEAGRLDDGDTDEFEKSVFRNINHVGIVSNVTNKANGDITIFECSPFYSSQIGSCKLSASSNASIVRSAHLMSRIVFVARHPAAFDNGGNVPDKFTTI